jgi:hypothetical protein
MDRTIKFMKKHIYKIIFAIVLSLLFAGKSLAETNQLPEMMVGQASAVVDGKTFYGGMTGNYAVYNSDTTTSYGFRIARLTLLPGANPCLENPTPLCFIFGTGPLGEGSTGNSKLMTSRTTVDAGDGQGAKTLYELPALFLGINTIVGDVFGPIDYSKFSFWGNNISITSDTTAGNASDASWNLKNYPINSGSQSAWVKTDGTNTDAFNQYYDKVKKLADNATTISSSDITTIIGGHDIYLQQSKINGGGVAESALYPEGKTWVVDGDLVLNSTVTYHGKGTIIVKGNITVGSGVKIIPALSDPNANKLGIMSITN